MISPNETGIQLIVKKNGQISQKSNCEIHDTDNLMCMNYIPNVDYPNLDNPSILAGDFKLDQYNDALLELFLRLPDGNSGYEELKIFEFEVEDSNIYMDNIPVIDGYTENNNIKQYYPAEWSHCDIDFQDQKVQDYIQKNESDEWVKNIPRPFATVYTIYILNLTPF